MKRRIRLTEGDLHRVIKESVKKVINEIGDTRSGQELLGQLALRKNKNQQFGKEKEIYNYAKKNFKMPSYDPNTYGEGDYSEYEYHGFDKGEDGFSTGYDDGVYADSEAARRIIKLLMKTNINDGKHKIYKGPDSSIIISNVEPQERGRIKGFINMVNDKCKPIITDIYGKFGINNYDIKKHVYYEADINELEIVLPSYADEEEDYNVRLDLDFDE